MRHKHRSPLRRSCPSHIQGYHWALVRKFGHFPKKTVKKVVNYIEGVTNDSNQSKGGVVLRLMTPHTLLPTPGASARCRTVLASPSSDRSFRPPSPSCSSCRPSPSFNRSSGSRSPSQVPCLRSASHSLSPRSPDRSRSRIPSHSSRSRSSNRTSHVPVHVPVHLPS